MSNQKTLVVIKHMSVRRGDGISILRDILRLTSCHLLDIYSTYICETSYKALCTDTKAYPATMSSRDFSPGVINSLVWVCTVEITDSEKSIYDELIRVCGPVNKKEWINSHLRYKYSSHYSKDDDVVHITHPLRYNYEKSILSEPNVRV